MTKPPFSLPLPLPPSLHHRIVFIVRSIFKCIVDVHRHVPPNFNFTLRAKGFTFWFFSFSVLTLFRLLNHMRLMTVSVVVVVGVADTRNFVCCDDSFPLYAHISVSLVRGWWGRRVKGRGELRVASSFFITNLPNRRCHILWDITQMPQNWNNNYNKICWILIAELRTILHKACVYVSTQQLHCFTAWTYSTCSTCTPHDTIHRQQQQQSMSFQSSSAMCVCVCVCEVDLGTFALQTRAWCWFFSRHKSAVVCLDSFAWKSYG